MRGFNLVRKLSRNDNSHVVDPPTIASLAKEDGPVTIQEQLDHTQLELMSCKERHGTRIFNMEKERVDVLNRLAKMVVELETSILRDSAGIESARETESEATTLSAAKQRALFSNNLEWWDAENSAELLAYFRNALSLVRPLQDRLEGVEKENRRIANTVQVLEKEHRNQLMGLNKEIRERTNQVWLKDKE